jgi:HIT domain
MDEYVFSAIVAGKGEASMVYDDKTVCAFLKIGYFNPGLVLVIPKQHRPFLSDLDEETGIHLFRVSMHMAKALRHSGLRCEASISFLTTGKRLFRRCFMSICMCSLALQEIRSKFMPTGRSNPPVKNWMKLMSGSGVQINPFDKKCRARGNVQS